MIAVVKMVRTCILCVYAVGALVHKSYIIVNVGLVYHDLRLESLDTEATRFRILKTLT